MTAFLSVTLFPALMIVAGAGDALTMRIPNRLTILIALLFFPMAVLTGMPWADLGLHVLVGIGMFVVGFLLFSLGLFGGGDAKLLAAAGLWLGWPDLMSFLFVTAIAGGVLAICVAAWSVFHVNAELHGSAIAKRFTSIKPNVPYGYAFAIGAVLAFPETWWFGVAA